MAGDKVSPLPLSAVSMEMETEVDEKQHAPPADPPPFPGVRDVIIWALINAGCFAFLIAYALIMPSRRPRAAVEMKMTTEAEAEVELVLAAGWLLCVVTQVAAAALALALPRRRWRRLRLVLAYAALVATAAGHSMWAALHGLFVVAQDGGRLCFKTAVTTVVILAFLDVDFLCFRGLILHGGGEEEEE